MSVVTECTSYGLRTHPPPRNYRSTQMSLESASLESITTSPQVNQSIPPMNATPFAVPPTMNATTPFVDEELGSNSGLETIHLDSNPRAQIESPQALIDSPSSAQSQMMVTVAKKASAVKAARSKNSAKPKINTSTQTTKKVEKKKENATLMKQLTNSASDLIRTAYTNAVVGASTLVGADGIFEGDDNNRNVPSNSNEQVANIENNMIAPASESNQQVVNFDPDVFLWSNDNIVNTIPTDDISSPTSSKRSRPRDENPNDDRIQYKTHQKRAESTTTIIPYTATVPNGVRRRRK